MSFRIPRHLALFALAAAYISLPASAQRFFPKNTITVGGGAGIPGLELKPAFTTRPMLSVGYGYRINRYLQADTGFDTVFFAAGVRAFENTQFGALRIRDYQWFIPFGGRAVIPMAEGRFIVSAGAGGTWMRYTERLRQPSDFIRFQCFTCSSRSGWGTYGLVSARYNIERYQRLWVGFTARVIRGNTDGEAIGGVPSIRTRDRWINTTIDVGFSF
jgi:hypothetical protein